MGLLKGQIERLHRGEEVSVYFSSKAEWDELIEEARCIAIGRTAEGDGEYSILAMNMGSNVMTLMVRQGNFNSTAPNSKGGCCNG